MSIELIKKEAQGKKKEDIILFVHGAWHGAWVWEKYFMEYFSQAGYESYALSFRGHGNSPSPKGLNRISMKDYLKDLLDVVDGLEQEPIIIGHCMGGLVVQKFLEQRSCKKVVLMASIPPQGALRTILNVNLTRYYALVNVLRLNLYGLVNTPSKAKWALFSDNISEEELNDCTKRVGGESFRVFLEMIVPNVKVNYHDKIPMLVLGAENDHIITVKENKKTAAKYKAELKMMPNTAHNLMLDVENKSVANEIISWLN